jgi:hypothetical protein
MSVSDVGRISCWRWLGRTKIKKRTSLGSVSAVGMFEGCLPEIQWIGPMSEVDIFWTSTGLTCVMWGDGRHSTDVAFFVFHNPLTIFYHQTFS